MRKEFIKLHILLQMKSPKSWYHSFRITKDNVHDTKQFGSILKESVKRHDDIDKAYGGKAYDSRKNLLGDINAMLLVVLERMHLPPSPRDVD